MLRLRLACLVVGCFSVSPLMAQQAVAPRTFAWSDASLPAERRAEMVVKELTLDEKIGLVHGIGWGPLRAGDPVPADNNGGAGQVLGVPRLGIPSLQQADSAVGVRMAAQQSRYATLLPSVLGAAASWDVTAAHLYGDVIGRELRAQGFNQSIGGGVNLARDPRNGRLFEYPGEDPVLAGTTVGHVIAGVQGNGVMGDIKHYALNDQETGRTIVDVRTSHKAMRESDLLAFEIGIRIGHPASVMCSYNKIDGDWACENDYLLQHVLKGQWGFPGFVVSDWEATHSAAKAALAGLDMEMPGEVYFGAPLKKAVEAGTVPQARLDDMVRRLLRSMFAAGVMDGAARPRMVVDPFKGREDAQRIAEESIVLLRNEKGVLPVDAGRVKRIAVIGGHADVGVMSGGGSAQVDAPGGNAIKPGEPTAWGRPVYFPSAPLRYIREHAPGAQVTFDAGTDVASAAAAARGADVAIVFADQYMQEGEDRATLALPGGQDALIAAVAAANPRTVVVLVTGNPVSMPWVKDVAGVMEAWYPGIGGGQAIANVLFGTVNPSGRLPITFARTEADLPHAKVFGLELTEKQREAGFQAPYTEGAAFGYKWFEQQGKTPLFWFGHGLSYTTFAYRDLKVDAQAGTASVTLENTGERAGDEVAQVYVQLPAAAGEKFHRLAGWQRVTLAAHEKKTVTVGLERLALASFDEKADRWTWPAGEYSVGVGPSAGELKVVVKAGLGGVGR